MCFPINMNQSTFESSGSFYNKMVSFNIEGRVSPLGAFFNAPVCGGGVKWRQHFGYSIILLLY